jgi:hypothetical protein
MRLVLLVLVTAITPRLPGAALTDPCNVSATETDAPGASELRVAGT